MWTAIAGIVSGVVNFFGTAIGSYFERKKIEAQGAVAIAVAETEARVIEIKTRAEVMAKQATAEIDWDAQWAKQAERSWKDEWFTLLVSIPLIWSFMGPESRAAVAAGFKALETMPAWYQVTLGIAVAAAFGYRKIVDVFTTLRGNKK